MPDPISWAAVWPYFAAAFVASYLSGSIPFGLLLTRLAGLGDVRKIGSGNIGATNVLRTGRKDLAAGTLLLDALKGAVPVLVAWRVGGADFVVTAALGAFLGHLFPVWLGFRGGKGVATYIGVLLAASWPAGLAFAGIWLTTAFVTRFSSLAALLAALATPIVLAIRGELQYAEIFGVLTALLWFKHAANIARLLKGTESRIGKK
ncbi:glycerol-3-phosphate 1-O-acyltransferase PlsY [Acuticoccus sp. I52.16.1]|uniref:glycerol-3-phosphate 1-O-acyltransferase PlsY n=1 Tax=Acuticoccus sp. I52.16.1 TaxID=2928472 RepID=UPI001FD1A80D|nr:glycerol-3-phosphate 1-O-acyltransferase PlsY [Acuticoccus sp. I52.16.1]UOM33548.1 glycerol-3-phosphate 1-O-acyltransferase PlsY [Acuticoccus sp. I52.16.1]